MDSCIPPASNITPAPGQSSHSFLKIFIFIVIQLQLSAFSPHPSTPPQPVPPPSPTSTLPLDFVLVSFIVAPVNPSPHYLLPTPLWLLLHCSYGPFVPRDWACWKGPLPCSWEGRRWYLVCFYDFFNELNRFF